MKLSREKFKDAVGMCTDCGEWTSVLEPCCNAAVHFEGAGYGLEDFEDEHECQPGVICCVQEAVYAEE